jgi:hypothetical protein
LKRGFGLAPLQSQWVQERIGLSPEKITQDVRILFSDNSLVAGAYAYLYIFKRIWWTAPFGFFFSLPGLRFLFGTAYRIFNRNRFFVSRVCRLKPDLPAGRGKTRP